MKEQDKIKRAAPVSYRPPKDREAEFHERVAASGLSANAFITEAIFGRSRYRPAELRILAQQLARTADISDQLHDIKLAGATCSGLAIEQVLAELAEIRAALLTLMGRTP